MNNTFQKPYRVGKAQSRAVLDSQGKEVVIFARGMEAWAKDYCQHLNTAPEITQEPVPPMDAGKEPNKLVLWLYIILIEFPKLCYRYFTRKAFFVTGTFIDPQGVRRYCRITFCTYGNIMPIRSLEIKTAKQMGIEQCTILNFCRIPYGMVKYLENEMEVKINDF